MGSNHRNQPEYLPWNACHMTWPLVRGVGLGILAVSIVMKQPFIESAYSSDDDLIPFRRSECCLPSTRSTSHSVLLRW